MKRADMCLDRNGNLNIVMTHNSVTPPISDRFPAILQLNGSEIQWFYELHSTDPTINDINYNIIKCAQNFLYVFGIGSNSIVSHISGDTDILIQKLDSEDKGRIVWSRNLYTNEPSTVTD